MGTKGILIVSGACALLFPIAGILSIVAIELSGAGAEELAELDSWKLSLSADTRLAYLTSDWLDALTTLLSFPVGLALFLLLKDRGEMLWFALAGWVVGHVVVLFGDLTRLTITYKLAPSYAEASDAVKPGIAAVAEAMQFVAEDLTPSVGGLLAVGVGVAIYSVAILGSRSTIMPKWSGWLGLVAAVLMGWIGALGPVSDAFLALWFIGFMAFVIWVVSMGVFFLRAKRPDDTIPST